MPTGHHPHIYISSIYIVLLVWMGNTVGALMSCKGNGGSSVASCYTLDLTNRTAVQRIDEEITAPQTKKFVQFEVTDVFNPQLIPFIFKVYYQTPQGEKSLLGLFTLYPPDNPGTFIVATGGKLQSSGLIILTLVPVNEVDKDAEIRVHLKCFTFIED